MIRIKTTGLKEAQVWYTQRINKLKTKKRFFEDYVLPIVRREIKLNFSTEGRPGPGRKKWMELAEQTVAFREKKGYPGEHPILERDGILKGMATNPKVTWRGEVLALSVGEGKYGRIMAALHYGNPSQEGEINFYGQGADNSNIERGTGALPARPFFFITKQAEEEILNLARDYFFGDL